MHLFWWWENKDQMSSVHFSASSKTKAFFSGSPRKILCIGAPTLVSFLPFYFTECREPRWIASHFVGIFLWRRCLYFSSLWLFVSGEWSTDRKSRCYFQYPINDLKGFVGAKKRVCTNPAINHTRLTVPSLCYVHIPSFCQTTAREAKTKAFSKERKKYL